MISIIVPIYKIESLLPECIDSIINQSYLDLEIILVDDGSPDRCPIICDEYAKRDSRIKVIHKTNGGLVSARKAGLEIATGEYISYVDGDDWIEPKMYEEMMSHVLNYNVDMVIAGFKKDIGGIATNKINSLQVGYYDKKGISDEIISDMMFADEENQPGIYTYVWNKLFRKSILYKYQMDVYDGISLGEDAAVVYPMILNCKSIYISESCCYHYRQRADSMLKLGSKIENDINRIRLLYSFLYRKFSESEYINRLEKELNKYTLYLLTSRTGGIKISDKVEGYLYKNKYFGEKVAIYGAGTLGQHLYRRLFSIEKHEVVKWVDPDYMILRQHGLNVDSPNSINEVSFDSIVVAILDKENTNIIISDLKQKGIDASKIIISDFASLDYNKILKDFGIK